LIFELLSFNGYNVQKFSILAEKIFGFFDLAEKIFGFSLLSHYEL